MRTAYFKVALAATLVALAATMTLNIPEPPSHVYTLFLPMVYAPQPHNLKGVAMAYPPDSDVAAVGARWCYAWSLDPPQCELRVPMVSTAYVPDHFGGNTLRTLLYNEPNRTGQSNLTEREATIASHDLMVQFPERQWLSPAPAHVGDGEYADGLEWMRGYLETYRAFYGVKPPFAGLAFHTYHQSAAEAIAYTREWIALADEWGYGELWLTEFSFIWRGYPRPISEALRELDLFLDYLTTEPRVTGYAYFTNRGSTADHWTDADFEATLLLEDGTLSPFGAIYRNH